MLGYVAIIALVMIVFQFLPGFRQQRENPAPVAPVAEGDQPFRVLEDTDERLEPDEFRSLPSDPLPGNPLQSGSVSDTAGRQRGAGGEIAIDREILATVKDNTLSVRREESSAFFYTLDRARQIPPATFERRAEQGVQYLNLMHEPGRYRGEPVTIVGDLWHLYEFQASENPYGLKSLYEAWILTADSGNRPYRVVCSSLGPEVTVETPLPIRVKVTGYFFKREGYRSRGENGMGGQHVAPTLLASRLNRYISPNEPPPADGLVPVIMGIVIAIGLILATTLISFAWSDRRTPARVQKLPPMSTRTAEELSQLDHRSVRDQLRELEDRHRIAEWSHGLPHDREQHDPRRTPHEQNGHARTSPQPDESLPELPTPLPPTRSPRRSRFEGEEETP